jgi:hypothetical protein
LKYVIFGNVIWKVSFLTGFHLTDCGQELNNRETRINQASGEIIIIIIIVIIVIIIITYQQHNIIDNMLALPDVFALSMMTLWRGAVVGNSSDGGGCVMETSSSLFLAVNS